MPMLALRSLMLATYWLVASAPSCESDLERSDLGKACTRARDCMPHLDCIAGECRSPTDADAGGATTTDASSTDAGTDGDGGDAN